MSSPINLRIKLAALWISLMFCYIYGDYFELYVPGKLAGMISSESMLNSPMKLFAAAILLVVPALMISISVITRYSIARLSNIVFGIFYTLVMLLVGLSSISVWNTFYVFFAGVECAITILIVLYALKWQSDGN